MFVCMCSPVYFLLNGIDWCYKIYLLLYLINDKSDNNFRKISIRSIDVCSLDWCRRSTVSFLLRHDGFALGRTPLHDGRTLDRHDLQCAVVLGPILHLEQCASIHCQQRTQNCLSIFDISQNQNV